MQLSIASIRERRGASLPFDFIVPPDQWAPLGGEAAALAPVHVHGHVTNTGESMLVQGEASGEFGLVCARCLQPIRASLRAPLEERFRRQTGRSPQREREWDETLGDSDGEDDARSYHGDWLNLEDAVREALLLQVPMKPVCRPDCRGLCPQCGANLNQGDCGCETETVDPRLAALREWAKPRPKSNEPR
ncbi:MAG: hypothetical protein BAA04_06270 [Firmicutes bacterium ZCTH02-B6]|nr:MAG: hypothetical protein BAA04_06270 [Firmicutes bacterium ZCTH02-B6]